MSDQQNDLVKYGRNEPQQDSLLPEGSIGSNTLLRYLDVLHRRWWIVLGITILTLIVAYIYAIRMPEKYTFSFSIVYQDKVKENTIEGLRVSSGDSFDNSLWFNIMKSYNLIQSVSDLMVTHPSPDAILQVMRVEQKRDSDNIFIITLTTTDKQMFPHLPEAFVDALNKYERTEQDTSIDSLLATIGKLQTTNESQLNAIHTDIKNYMILHDTQGVDELTKEILKMDQYKNDLASAVVELESIRSSKAALQNTMGGDSSELSTLIINTDPLKKSLQNLQMELSEAQTKYTDKHPKVISLKQNISIINDLINNKVTTEEDTFAGSLNLMDQTLINQLISLNIKEIEFETRISSWRKAIADLNTTITNLQGSDEGLQQLLRKQVLLEQTSNDILSSKLAMLVKTGEFIRHFRLLDLPVMPLVPANKMAPVYVLIGLMLGLGLGFMLSLVYEAFTNRIYSTEALERLGNCPIICSIPVLATKLKTVFGDEQSRKDFLLPFTILKVKVKVSYVKDNCNFIALVSPAKNEGKTTICISLALELAKDGFKVLLLDSDLWSPSLSRFFALQHHPGLSDCLNDPSMNVSCVIYPTEVENLSIIPAGTRLGNIGSLLRPDTINELQQKIRYMYDWVITDTPALLLVPDSYEFISFAPTLYMVTRMSLTTYVDFKEMIAHLKMARIHLSGIIVNSMKSGLFSRYYQPEYIFRYDYYRKNAKLKNTMFKKAVKL